jgi:hypothetical protein
MTITLVEINCKKEKVKKTPSKVLTHQQHQNQFVRTTSNWLLFGLSFSIKY